MSEQDLRYIEKNLHLYNRELASQFNMNERSFKRLLRKHQLRRSEEQMEQIHLRRGEQQRGARNPNWKNGISKNNYHYKRLQKKRYPERVRAREIVSESKKSGKLIPGCCEICGNTENIQAHHSEYSAPLAVEWLCEHHHRLVHSGMIENKVYEKIKQGN